MIKNKKRKIRTLILIIAGILIAGSISFTLSWYSLVDKLGTISIVQTPSLISITGSQRNDLTRISLDKTSDDTIDENDIITLRRVFCIETTDDFYLEIAHTTNIPDLSFKLYPVKNSNSEKVEKTDGAVAGREGSTVVYYTPDSTTVAGGYLNLDNSSGIAILEGETGSKHNATYDEEDSNKVQKNAEPLYWRSSTLESVGAGMSDYWQIGENNGMNIYYRYYVIEITFSSSTQETDLFYLIASH